MNGLLSMLLTCVSEMLSQLKEKKQAHIKSVFWQLRHWQLMRANLRDFNIEWTVDAIKKEQQFTHTGTPAHGHTDGKQKTNFAMHDATQLPFTHVFTGG